MRKRMFQMLAAVLVVVAVLGFVKFQQIRAAMAGGKSFQPPPEAVTTVVARLDRWDATLTAVGSVAPVQGVMLSADQPGVVARIAFQSGSRAEAGQALVVLDTRQELAQLASAQAQRDLAETNLERSRRLLAERVIAQADFDQVAAQSKQAQASVEEFRAVIERKTIRAPFRGVTGIRQVNLGQYLRSGDPVVELQAMDPVYVDFAVPQQEFAALHVGDAIRATADSSVRATLTGRVTAINPVIDEDTRNVRVQATFPNPRGLLRAGMYVTVSVSLGASRPVVAVPISAVNYAPYGNSVFLVEDLKGPGGKPYRGVRQQFVRLGEARGDRIAVLDGVKPGQEIVSSGVFKLRTGAAVVVNNKVRPSDDLTPRPEDS
jgi:membrane fusion protein (multidrug efflux system)